MNRRDWLRGAASIAALQALAACGGGGSGDSTSPIIVVSGPTPAPTPAPTPPPTLSPTPTDTIKSRLKTFASSVSAPELFGAGATLQFYSAGDPSPISQRTLIRQDAGSFRYVGIMDRAGNSYPLDQMTTNRAVNYGSGRGSNEYFIEFATDAQIFEVVYHGNGSNSANRVKVNGRYIRSETVEAPNDGGFYVSRVTLPDRQMRNVRVEAVAMNFYGVNIASTDTIQAPSQSDALRAIFLGDSITEGTSGVAGVNPFEVYASRTAQSLGWEALYRSGVGSTGYLAAPGGRLKLRDRLTTDVYSLNPEVIVIAAGINDPLDGLRAEAEALFSEIQSRLPATQIFVVGPWGPGGYAGQSAKAGDIRAAVGSRPNFTYIDNSTWQTGNGNVANPNGSGNGDQYVGPDGVHPTQAGHTYLATRLTADMRSTIQAWA
jgi:lysophospholipase L1-like esterase